ncbi:alpha/beta hydrolase [Anaerolentibacter hominis]|uniref:alpha/beta fold hydrolase n=1 Tax=Anaerolentibacter hominis TaxID=3079009 RepID=UPI0031B89310
MAYFKYGENNIYYEEAGTGLPLVFLHGDTASSKMFELLLPLYQDSYKVILVDFLGNGKSDRMEGFPADLWFSQAQQVIALLEYLDCGKAGLVGTSGGAWSAVNTALERPDLVKKVVADSFDGRTLAEDFSANLLEERASAKRNDFSRQFYEWCQGEDWETVVDLNTKALTECAENKLPLFHKPLETLKVPILFTGSVEDTMCRKDMAEEYRAMNLLVPDGTIHLFPSGGHPAMLTNAEEFAETVKAFFRE